jgi:hypothetical protein
MVTSPDWRRWDALWGQDKGSRKSSYKRLQASSDSTVFLRSLHDGYTNGRRPEESDPRNPHSHFWILDTDQSVTGVPPVTVRSRGRSMEKQNSLLTRIWVRLKAVLTVFERTANFITPSNRNNPDFFIWWRTCTYLQSFNIYINVAYRALSQNSLFPNVLSTSIRDRPRKINNPYYMLREI